ncbi:MAG: hypothetical protein H7Y31_04005 [Chitinophagaceae bacterium]|nr:hypothetical protein [Chitinophagaceae bacterium]
MKNAELLLKQFVQTGDGSKYTNVLSTFERSSELTHPLGASEAAPEFNANALQFEKMHSMETLK